MQTTATGNDRMNGGGINGHERRNILRVMGWSMAVVILLAPPRRHALHR